MNEEWMIDVAGVSAGGWQVETEELVMRAELIVAGQRILDMITRRDVEKIPLDASALRNLERILARAKEKRTLFLASGDPLYNGIGGTLRRYLPEERLRIHPNPTAFQELLRNWRFRGRMRLCSVCMGKKLCRGGESSAQSWP